jgi:hypothetical protein
MGGCPVMPPSGCECSRARPNYGWLTKTSWVPGRRARDITVGSVGLRRRSGVLIVLATAVVLTGLTAGAAFFQPWQLFVDRRVDDALPGAVPAAPTPVESSPAEPAPSTAPATSHTMLLSKGNLITHEHPTSGRVKIIATADGRRLLRIADLDTTSGPDLRVWLSAGPVIEGRKGWFVFAKYPYVELGKLKANQGNQNYEIPDETDLKKFTSVSVWCKRFRVSFGAAALN